MYQAKKTANYVFGFKGKNEAFLTNPVGLNAADLQLFPEGPMEMLEYLGGRGFSKLPEAINELFPRYLMILADVYRDVIRNHPHALFITHPAAMTTDLKVIDSIAHEYDKKPRVVNASPFIVWDPQIRKGTEVGTGLLHIIASGFYPEMASAAMGGVTQALEYHEFKTTSARRIATTTPTFYMMSPDFAPEQTRGSTRHFTGALEVPYPPVPEEVALFIEDAKKSGRKVIGLALSTPGAEGNSQVQQALAELQRAAPDTLVVTAGLDEDQVQLLQQHFDVSFYPILKPTSFEDLARLVDGMITTLGANMAHVITRQQVPTLPILAAPDQEHRETAREYRKLQRHLITDPAKFARLVRNFPTREGEVQSDEAQNALVAAVLTTIDLATQER